MVNLYPLPKSLAHVLFSQSNVPITVLGNLNYPVLAPCVHCCGCCVDQGSLNVSPVFCFRDSDLSRPCTLCIVMATSIPGIAIWHFTPVLALFVHCEGCQQTRDPPHSRHCEGCCTDQGSSKFLKFPSLCFRESVPNHHPVVHHVCIVLGCIMQTRDPHSFSSLAFLCMDFGSRGSFSCILCTNIQSCTPWE